MLLAKLCPALVPPFPQPASDLLLAALPGGAYALTLLLGAQTLVISLPSVLIKPYFGSHFLRISLCCETLS